MTSQTGCRLFSVSLIQLEYFVAVAEVGHVGRAAQRLHISQPPLSRSLRSLEEELGVELFERTPKGMELLPTGKLFLEHARRILAAVDAARQTLLDWRNRDAPQVEPTGIVVAGERAITHDLNANRLIGDE